MNSKILLLLIVSDRATLVFFVLDINGALSPQTKEFIDALQAAVKPKGHARFSKFLLRDISSALARFRAFTVEEFTRCALKGRLPSN